jgi:hypothetical protein
MGSIDRRRGKYIARWRDPDGRQRSESFDRAGDAKRHLSETEAQINRGTWIDPAAGKLTVREYSTTWLAGLASDPLTREGIDARWRTHINPMLGTVPLAALKPSRVQQWVAALKRSGLAAGTVRNILTDLSAALNAAVDDRLIPSNPCASKSVTAPRTEKRKVIPWEAGRVAAVRAGLPERYRATVDCGAGLGLRKAKCSASPWTTLTSYAASYTSATRYGSSAASSSCHHRRATRHGTSRSPTRSGCGSLRISKMGVAQPGPVQ